MLREKTETGESVRGYASALRQLAVLAFLDITAEDLNEQIPQRFITGANVSGLTTPPGEVDGIDLDKMVAEMDHKEGLWLDSAKWLVSRRQRSPGTQGRTRRPNAHLY